MIFPPAAANPLRTRLDLQTLTRDLITPLVPHFSSGRALIKLGPGAGWYGEPPSSFEGFARALWGLVPLAAGHGEFSAWDRWREGIAHGTDPDHPEFWGWPEDRNQRLVESAALGFGLNLAPDQLWAPLPPDVKARFSTWLQRTNTVASVDNNWLFFQVMVNLGLRRCGLPTDDARVEANLDRLDDFYLGDGVYADGDPTIGGNDGRIGDYYGPMALHFYGLIYAATADHDPVRGQRYRDRAAAFAGDFAGWFNATGAALPFGRSLTYRFAQGAFWGALALAGVEALPWGVIKGLYLRHLRWWLQQPIFTETGVLTVGYTYPNLVMAESYNGPGSPYWAMKALLPLALPESHPFWQAEEAPLPPRPAIRTAPRARQVVTASADGHEVTILNAGQAVNSWPRHASHKYSKFAYSIRFGFSIPVGYPNLAEGGFDNMLALSDDQGDRFRGREAVLRSWSHDGTAYSAWAPWPDVEVETWLIATTDAYLRVHRLETARPLVAVEAGFATGYCEPATVHWTQATEAELQVASPDGFSALRNLSAPRDPQPVELGVNSHLLRPLAAMPTLRTDLEPGTHWLASLVWGGAQPADHAAPEWTFAAQDDRSFSLTRDGIVQGVFAVDPVESENHV